MFSYGDYWHKFRSMLSNCFDGTLHRIIVWRAESGIANLESDDPFFRLEFLFVKFIVLVCSNKRMDFFDRVHYDIGIEMLLWILEVWRS